MDSTDRLRRDKMILLEMTVAKQKAENKVIHEMLSAAGIPEDLANDGVKSCLRARVAALLDRR